MTFNIHSKGGLKMKPGPMSGMHCAEIKLGGEKFIVIASVDHHNGMEVEHVSVSRKSKFVPLEVLNFFKLQFWDESDEVYKIFCPDTARVINTAHLWRRADGLGLFDLPTFKRTVQ